MDKDTQRAFEGILIASLVGLLFWTCFFVALNASAYESHEVYEPPAKEWYLP